MSYPYPPTYTTYPTATYNPITGQTIPTVSTVYPPTYPPTYTTTYPTAAPVYPYNPTYPARIY